MRLVVASFVDSYADAHAAGLVAFDDWRDVMTPQVCRILSRAGVEVTVAYHPDEPDRRADVYGWVAVERGYDVIRKRREHGRWVEKKVPTDEPLVHYVFVKQPFRQMGLARRLFHAAGVDPMRPFNHTCKTGVVSKLAPKVPFARWQPLIARFPKPSNP